MAIKNSYGLFSLCYHLKLQPSLTSWHNHSWFFLLLFILVSFQCCYFLLWKKCYCRKLEITDRGSRKIPLSWASFPIFLFSVQVILCWLFGLTLFSLYLLSLYDFSYSCGFNCLIHADDCEMYIYSPNLSSSTYIFFFLDISNYLVYWQLKPSKSKT